jgi:hypothetical protein
MSETENEKPEENLRSQPSMLRRIIANFFSPFLHEFPYGWHKIFGRDDEATAVLEKGAQSFVGLRRLGWRLLCNTYYEQDRWDDLALTAKKALTLFPAKKDQGAFWNILGCAQSSQKSDEESLVSFRNAHDCEPDNSVIKENFLNALIDTKNHRKWLETKQKFATEKFQVDLGYVEQWKKKHSNSKSVKPEQRPIIVGLTVDLKVPPVGTIKICEFNALPRSGMVGFGKAYGYDLKKEIIIPWQNSLAREFKKSGVAKGIDFADGKADMETAIRMFEASRNQKIYADSAIGSYLMTHYKDYTARIVEEIGTSVNEFFPKTLILPKGVVDGRALQTFMTEHVSGSHVIVKSSAACVGDGVQVVSKSDLPRVLAAIGGLTQEDVSGVDRSFWERDYHPNVLIQDIAHSAPAKASDGRYYDGAMRVALTLVCYPATGKMEACYHGAWWKLPSQTCDSDDLQHAIVSFSPSHLGHESNKALTDGTQPLSAQVDAKIYGRVADDLNSCLQALAPHFTASVLHCVPMLLCDMQSRSAARENLALEIATSSPFADLMHFESPQDVKSIFYGVVGMKAKRQDFATDFVRRMTDFEPKTPSDFYLQGSRSPVVMGRLQAL